MLQAPESWSKYTTNILNTNRVTNIVDVELLIKRLTILGLPRDVINSINNWLEELFLFALMVTESMVRVTLHGIVQGSILGPILYAIL